uniref:Uncharacterized protein n=1 Tax=Setaria viridis TaxID=4556 RepID=A0A4U6SPJ2_SETVI|nr:hypothetical protein SEVIR_9G035700v2 [Setaria viridis]
MANSIRLSRFGAFFPFQVGEEGLPPELAGAARTRTPSATNYDVHSPTWGDGKPAHPPSAMRATDLGHGPS